MSYALSMHPGSDSSGSDSTSKTLRRKPSVLVVDDNESDLQFARQDLGDDYNVITATSISAGLTAAKRRAIDIVLLDIEIPKDEGGTPFIKGGIDFIPNFRNACPGAEVIMFSHHDRAELGVEAIRQGAFDFVVKPYFPEQLLGMLERALHQQRTHREILYLREEIDNLKGGEFIFGETPRMRQVSDTINRVAPTDATVLVTGETGTGKEMVARAIHARSARNDGPFVAVSLSERPKQLLSSFLFGHEQGAFTGASETRVGRFETAHGGTLFLDEIGELDLESQAKLLRVLQEGEFERIGGNKVRETDVRIIAATNRDLKRAVERNEFREDLYFRLNVVPIQLPPLRDRLEDLGALLHLFLTRHAKKYGRPVPEVRPAVLNLLRLYEWPGNVRELEQLVQRLLVLIPEDSALTEDDLPLEYRYPGFLNSLQKDQKKDRDRDVLRKAIEAFERDFILKTLARCDWRRQEAAKRLGIHQATLFRKLNKLGLYGTIIEPLQKNAGGRRFAKKDDEEDSGHDD